MEFTQDHFVYFLGILMGVGLTLIGIWFTEYLKDRRLKQRLINALYEEIRMNIKKSDGYFTLINKNSKRAILKSYTPFDTIAYQQYKLALMIDERIIPNLSDTLVNAYMFADLFNSRIDEFNNDDTNKLGQKELLKSINEYMKKLKEKFDPFIKEDKP